MEQDGRIYRLWYLPNKWGKINFEKLTDWSEYVSNGENATDWNEIVQSGWNLVEQLPHIFLSRAPLTFGHSQLVIPSLWSNKISEEKFFDWASHIIKRAIATFRKVLYDEEVHNKNETFKNLAKLTKTEGKYIKTLILKVSADENIKKQYKVHLVPYFESHDIECKKRYDSRHRALMISKGGLLGWLGEREDDADKLEADSSLWKYILDDVANKDLKMVELANKMRDSWQQLIS